MKGFYFKHPDYKREFKIVSEPTGGEALDVPVIDVKTGRFFTFPMHRLRKIKMYRKDKKGKKIKIK